MTMKAKDCLKHKIWKRTKKKLKFIIRINSQLEKTLSTKQSSEFSEDFTSSDLNLSWSIKR